MEFRRQEEQLDWVEQTQKGQDASFVPALISNKVQHNAQAPSFRPRSLALSTSDSEAGKSCIGTILMNINGEDEQ